MRGVLASERVLRVGPECLDRLIMIGERHLRRAMAEFMLPYHAERNHQGLGNELIQPLLRSNTLGPVCRRQRKGGMLNYYSRAA
jgi:putative transposase